MAENIKIPLYLMFRNSEVAKIDIALCEKMLSVNNFKIINLKLLPYALQCADCNIVHWLMSRLMPSNTRHYIHMMPIVFHKGIDRRPYAQFALSLETNGLSLSDHYWLNTNCDMTFYYEGKTIRFKNETWSEINQWQDNIWSNDLDRFLFNDMLLAGYDDPIPLTNNPIFSTNGNKEKMWYKEDSEWVLEKRLSGEQLANEIECISFFQSRGFLTPEHKVIHHNVSDKYQFHPITIRSGFDTIQKRCLASKNNQLAPLSWYIGEECEDNIHSVIAKVKKVVNIEAQILKDFEVAIVDYLTTYNYKQLASSNLGFLIDCDNNAIPAVWSNAGYTDTSPFTNLISNKQES